MSHCTDVELIDILHYTALECSLTSFILYCVPGYDSFKKCIMLSE